MTDFSSSFSGSSGNIIDTPVVQHRVKPEWGAAVLVWRRDGKSGFQFEDGEIRAFRDDWLHSARSVA